MSNPVRVLVVDDQVLLRRSLVTILDAATDVEVVGEADNGRSAVAVARAVHPDVVLMDIRMPGDLDGIEATRAICGDPSLTGTKICVLTVFDEDAYVFRALQAGASGYLLKDTPPPEVVNAVRTVRAGQSLLSPGVLDTVVAHAPSHAPPPAPLADLTPRQTEVLRLVAQGLSNQEIEHRLRVSHSTLKTHMGALLHRLGARDRAQLVIAAYEGGLMSPR